MLGSPQIAKSQDFTLQACGFLRIKGSFARGVGYKQTDLSADTALSLVMEQVLLKKPPGQTRQAQAVVPCRAAAGSGDIGRVWMMQAQSSMVKVCVIV